MKVALLIIIFYFYLSIILLNSFSNCKEAYEYEENLNYYLSRGLSSSKVKSSIDEEEIKKNINPGEVQKEFLFNDKINLFNINSFNYNKENDLLIHFYPLDCNIKIDIESEYEDDKKDVNIIKINNYEFGGFYTIIQKDKLDKIIFKIKTLILINTIDDYNKNRTYHLIINSFEYINNSNLIIKEKEPTFLNFNNTIDKINLVYNLNNKEKYIHPISISFFIKEKVKFEIIVSNNEDKTIKKLIAYTDRILIDSNFIPESSSCINIHVEKIEKEKDAVMIIKVIGDYSTPIYFQKNILHLGFIPANVPYQYYYMEIFNGEEGEIMLNNKRYNGILISKLIPKGELDEYYIFDNSKFYPKKDERRYSLLYEDYPEYNEYSKKMTFNFSQTNRCINGCYLLITYYSIYLDNKVNERKLIGTEFTLLSRIMDEENSYKSQIVNIPLNEYIFGLFQSSSFNIHYYSLYIPENTEELIFEMNSIDIILYIYEGVKRFNIYKSKHIPFYGFLKYILKPDNFGLDSFGGKFITFAVSNLNALVKSNYYFRILKRNFININYLIYPLDTIIPSICETIKTKDKYSCFFLIDNTYKDLYNDIIIYADAKPKIKYTAWFEENNDNDDNNYYSIDLGNLEYKNKIEEENNNFFKIDNKTFVNSDFVLVNIQSDYEENITVFANFYDNISFFPSIQIYYSQLFYLNNNESFTFNFDFSYYNLYKIFINNTYGNGDICFDKDCKDKSNLSGKRILTSQITNGTNSIDIYSKFDSQLLFILKIDYGFENVFLKELQFNSDYKETKKSFPIGFFLKELEYKGVDINFFFDFNNLNKTLKKNDLIIKGYIINYDKIINFKYKEGYENGEEIYGKFDERTNNGLIVFEKEIIDKNNLGIDNYYLIIIESHIISEINLEVQITSKDAPDFLMPINKYISGSFNLKNIKQSQKYYINNNYNEQTSNTNYIVEFSSNYKSIELLCSKSIKEYKPNIIDGGIQKYFVNMDFGGEKENYFLVQLVNTETNNNYLGKGYYTLKYYSEDSEQGKNIYNIDHDLIFIDKTNSSYILKIEIKNNYNIKKPIDNYEFKYILNIYKKQEILKNELINTIAPIDSEAIYSNITSYNEPIKEITYYLNDIIPNIEYEISMFILMKNKGEELSSYYSYVFNIFEKNKKEDKDKDKNKLAFFLIIGLFIFIVIIIIVFFIIYKNMKKEKKSLEDQVRTISFSQEQEDEEEKIEDEKSFI